MANAFAQGPPGPLAASISTASAFSTVDPFGVYPSGSVAYVADTRTYWMRDRASVLAPDGIAVVAGNGGGNWLLWHPAAFYTSSIYGGGEDGAAKFDGATTFAFASLSGGVYTLTRDVFLADGATVAAGITVFSAGFRIMCAGRLTINGTIHCDGHAASGSSGGTTSTLGSLGVGTAGGAGRSATTGANGSAQSNGLQDAQSAGLCVGGAGGAGGANAGGNGGTYSAVVSGNGGANFLFTDLTGFFVGNASGGNQAQLQIVGGGAGGGGGGSDNASATGGGGGGGGGVLLLACWCLINNGVIRANGGAGAAGSGTAGNAGGGGGGGGGIILCTHRFMFGNAEVAQGGAGGAGFGTGATGSVGAAGHINRHTA